MEGRTVNDCWKTPCPNEVTFEVNDRPTCDEHMNELLQRRSVAVVVPLRASPA